MVDSDEFLLKEVCLWFDLLYKDPDLIQSRLFYSWNQKWWKITITCSNSDIYTIFITILDKFVGKTAINDR